MDRFRIYNKFLLISYFVKDNILLKMELYFKFYEFSCVLYLGLKDFE